MLWLVSPSKSRAVYKPMPKGMGFMTQTFQKPLLKGFFNSQYPKLRREQNYCIRCWSDINVYFCENCQLS